MRREQREDDAGAFVDSSMDRGQNRENRNTEEGRKWCLGVVENFADDEEDIEGYVVEQIYDDVAAAALALDGFLPFLFISCSLSLSSLNNFFFDLIDFDLIIYKYYFN